MSRRHAPTTRTMLSRTAAAALVMLLGLPMFIVAGTAALAIAVSSVTSIANYMRLGIDPKQADQLIRGTIVLPHGIGKAQRVVVFAKGDAADAAKAAGADEVGQEELAKRIQDGEIGDIVTMRAYRMTGPVGSAFSEKWPGEPSELLWQLKRFHSFIWASGGSYNDFFIHVIDHCCWMKNAWPVKAQALGGRHYKTSPEGVAYVDQNFDTYSVEYTFADGSTFIMDGRCMQGCKNIYASYAHGSKGMAVVSKSGDCGMPSSIHRGQKAERSNMVWQSKVKPQERSPYQNEWNDLIEAIRKAADLQAQQDPAKED